MSRKLLILLLFTASCFAQTTVTVTANVKSIFGTAQATKVQACFSLILSDGQRPSDPHVAGTGVLVPTQSQCVTPNGSGLISTTMVPNDLITVGGITSTTLYNVSWLYNGTYSSGAVYQFLLADVTEDLGSKSPVFLSPSVTVTPTDNVYMRLDAGNSPSSAAWGFKGLGILAGFDFQFGGGPGIYMDHTLFALGFKSTGFLGWAPSGFANAAFDTGESRCGVATVCFGNGTQGDVTGTVQGGGLVLGGGTALTTTNQTGTGSVVLGTAPTITNSTQNIINQPAATAFILKDNQGGTRYSIPAGGITQSTINNTNFTGAGNSNSVNLLNVQGPLAAVVGTGADVNLYTFTIPANTIQAGKGIRLKVSVNHSTGSAAVSYKLKLGSTALYTAGGAATSSATLTFDQEIFNDAGVQNTQFGQLIMIDSATITANITFTSAENAANSLALTFTMNVAATDQVTPKFWRVELIQ